MTEVNIPKLNRKISYQDVLLFAGSCFADNIGVKFAENKFNAMVNPYGVLYNPISVLQMLKHASGEEVLNNKDLILHDGLWHSFAHHGRFSTAEFTDLEHGIQQNKLELESHFNDTDYLFITWGTSWVYRYLETNRVVANCHKLPAKTFERFRLSTEEIVEKYSAWLLKLKSTHPKLKIVLTVSPVRHLKDTAHGNQLSKSVLILAAESLCEKFAQVTYFPSYEILLDELRDYRFYAVDMTHPNGLAIAYIWEKLSKFWMDKASVQLMPQIQKLVKAASHRPLNIETADHQQFVKSTMDKIKHFKVQNPQLNFNKELTLLTQQLIAQ